MIFQLRVDTIAFDRDLQVFVRAWADGAVIQLVSLVEVIPYTDR